MKNKTSFATIKFKIKKPKVPSYIKIPLLDDAPHLLDDLVSGHLLGSDDSRQFRRQCDGTCVTALALGSALFGRCAAAAASGALLVFRPILVAVAVASLLLALLAGFALLGRRLVLLRAVLLVARVLVAAALLVVGRALLALVGYWLLGWRSAFRRFLLLLFLF